MEAKELSKSMMGKKTKRLYDRMQHGIQKKQDAVEKLKNKREEVDNVSSSKQGKNSKRVQQEVVESSGKQAVNKKQKVNK